MGALPKNKITRAERGKRRAGNTPTVTVDVNTHAIPMHKRTLVASMMASMGYTKDAPKKEKVKRIPRQSSNLTNIDQRTTAVVTAPTGMDKSKHRAQHKG